jgi:hypothetical protein
MLGPIKYFSVAELTLPLEYLWISNCPINHFRKIVLYKYDFFKCV